jgi:hypothetical protein
MEPQQISMALEFLSFWRWGVFPELTVPFERVTTGDIATGSLVIETPVAARLGRHESW